MGRIAMFLTGVVAGVVGLGVTACLIDKYANSGSDNDCLSGSDEEQQEITKEAEANC